MKHLQKQEELETLCPGLVEEIQMFVESNPNHEGNEEASIYALAQVIQNKLDNIELDPADKGFVITILINGLIHFNQEALALHKQRVLERLEGMSSTKH